MKRGFHFINRNLVILLYMFWKISVNHLERSNNMSSPNIAIDLAR